MQIVNNTRGNVNIALGIFVPASGSITVEASAERKMRASPLVQAYVKAKVLTLVDKPVAEKEVAPLTDKPVIPKPAASKDV